MGMPLINGGRYGEAAGCEGQGQEQRMWMLCSFGPREVEGPGDVQAELTSSSRPVCSGFGREM